MSVLTKPSSILSASLFFLLGCGSEPPTPAQSAQQQAPKEIEAPAGTFTVNGGFFNAWIPVAQERRTFFTWARLSFADDTTSYAWIGG